MSKKEIDIKKINTRIGAEVISILPFLSTDYKKDNGKRKDDFPDLKKIESFLKIMEMNTDDIAGSVLAYYIYDISLFDDLDSLDLLEELKNRAIAHLDLYEQIKLNL